VIEQKNINPGKIHDKEKAHDVLSLYLMALKSPVTKDKYSRRLKTFFNFIGINGESMEEKCNELVEKSKMEGEQWVFNCIYKFIQFQLERIHRKEITGSTIQNYLKSIKLFCEIADISVKWNKLTRGLPRGKSYADDRIPTTEELQKLLEYPDRRIKSIIYTMTSSGIRLGAWDYLRWGHIRPIMKDNYILAAKILVYAGEDEEYFSFISEAYLALKEWINYRLNAGELVNDDSWLIRDLWDTQINCGTGLVTRPKKLASSGIKRLIERALWAQGLRNKLENGKKRHPYQAVHSLRKWFKTRCELGGMKPINIEKLLSHSIGISNSYYRPTENDLIEDYLRAVEFLSIDKEHKLQKQLNNYTQKSQQDNYLIKAQLHDKDEKINRKDDPQQDVGDAADNSEIILDETGDNVKPGPRGISNKKKDTQTDSILIQN
jgi:hypothetical protein